MSAEDQNHPGKPETFSLHIAGWRVLAGLVASPAAWLAQMTVSETLAAGACYPHQQPLSEAALAHLHTVLLAISATGLLAALFPVYAIGPALRSAWRESRAHRVIETGEGRTYFLVMTGMMTSLLFILAVLVTGIGNFMVMPCHPWQ